jgi:hypothetical protein
MLGGSLVFIKTIGSKYETILKGLIWFFFKKLFSYFQNLGKVSNFFKK